MNPINSKYLSNISPPSAAYGCGFVKPPSISHWAWVSILPNDCYFWWNLQVWHFQAFHIKFQRVTRAQYWFYRHNFLFWIEFYLLVGFIHVHRRTHHMIQHHALLWSVFSFVALPVVNEKSFSSSMTTIELSKRWTKWQTFLFSKWSSNSYTRNNEILGCTLFMSKTQLRWWPCSGVQSLVRYSEGIPGRFQKS